MNKTYSTSAVSLLEVMVAITIFFMGLISVYSVVSSTLRLNEYNKNFIIASNLAREQIEITKNIRDYNFSKIRRWDSIAADNTTTWEENTYYRVANNGAGFLDTQISKIDNFVISQDELATGMQAYRLCINTDGIYGYNCSGDNKKTPFYRYMKVSSVSYKDENGEEVIIENARTFESQVVWYKGGYHSTGVSIILTDWQRL